MSDELTTTTIAFFTEKPEKWIPGFQKPAKRSLSNPLHPTPKSSKMMPMNAQTTIKWMSKRIKKKKVKREGGLAFNNYLNKRENLCIF
jgi:hypothetical protein